MRVLIVDDSKTVRNFLIFAMSVFDAVEIDEAGDGIAASKLLSETGYDLMLLDINMPLMDGMKLLGWMQKKGGAIARTAAIVVSSEADAGTSKRALKLGAAAVLTKPVQAYAVRDAVREVLERSGPLAPLSDHEQRREPRLDAPVRVSVVDDPSHEMSTVDISPYGAFLADEHPIQIGTALKLRFELPHMPQPLDVDCQVVHNRLEATGDLPRGFGVSFSHENGDVSDQLFRAFLSPVLR